MLDCHRVTSHQLNRPRTGELDAAMPAPGRTKLATSPAFGGANLRKIIGRNAACGKVYAGWAGMLSRRPRSALALCRGRLRGPDRIGKTPEDRPRSRRYAPPMRLPARRRASPSRTLSRTEY